MAAIGCPPAVEVGADHPRRPGTWPSPAFTPEDPEEFLAMLAEVLGR